LIFAKQADQALDSGHWDKPPAADVERLLPRRFAKGADRDQWISLIATGVLGHTTTMARRGSTGDVSDRSPSGGLNHIRSISLIGADLHGAAPDFINPLSKPIGCSPEGRMP
jgi:hypothetical protein